MSFGITIEQYNYNSEVIYYCQFPEFYEFFKQKEGKIETCKRYFYDKKVLKELVKYLKSCKNPQLKEWIEEIHQELEDPDEKYMVWFS